MPWRHFLECHFSVPPTGVRASSNCSTFGSTYGLEMADGPLATLIARSVSVIDKDGKITYQELVPEIAQEPDYDAAIAAAKDAG